MHDRMTAGKNQHQHDLACHDEREQLKHDVYGVIVFAGVVSCVLLMCTHVRMQCIYISYRWFW